MFKLSSRNLESREGALDGRVALVTGASGGLGKAIVSELRERRTEVYAAEIAGEGVFHVDHSTPSGNRDMVAHVLATAGRLDILVLMLDASSLPHSISFLTSNERLRSVMLDGPFYGLKSAWFALTRSPGGRVVVTASPASYKGGRHRAGYHGRKARYFGAGSRRRTRRRGAWPYSECRGARLDGDRPDAGSFTGHRGRTRYEHRPGCRCYARAAARRSLRRRWRSRRYRWFSCQSICIGNQWRVHPTRHRCKRLGATALVSADCALTGRG
ncbi:hypothetical protein ACVIM8_001711 [Bradyrhizobium sp. USDA 4529]